MPAEGHVRLTPRPRNLLAELDRPDTGNALLPETVAALLDVLAAAERDPQCRALVIASTGSSFCLGADLKAMLRRGGLEEMSTGYWELLERLSTARVPTIALVEGPATGGGVGLAAACDLVVAGPAASFRLTEVLLGMLPTMLMPTLAGRIGSRLTLRLAMLAEPVGAAEAVRVGLADRLADEPRVALRSLLAQLGRADRETLADLKNVHRMLFGVDSRMGPFAERVFASSLRDRAAERIDRLAAEGLL
jgi:enoyl-CoA hydratase/carnithine racemase